MGNDHCCAVIISYPSSPLSFYDLCIAKLTNMAQYSSTFVSLVTNILTHCVICSLLLGVFNSIFRFSVWLPYFFSRCIHWKRWLCSLWIWAVIEEVRMVKIAGSCCVVRPCLEMRCCAFACHHGSTVYCTARCMHGFSWCHSLRSCHFCDRIWCVDSCGMSTGDARILTVSFLSVNFPDDLQAWCDSSCVTAHCCIVCLNSAMLSSFLAAERLFILHPFFAHSWFHRDHVFEDTSAYLPVLLGWVLELFWWKMSGFSSSKSL